MASSISGHDMNAASFFRLILLAAIFGGSFLFMRIGVPALGPALMIEYRVALAALFLALIGFILKKPMALRRNWRHYVILGFFNSGLPFLLFAIAARTLPASMLSVLNATAPIWGALIGAVWTRQPLSPRTILGLILGMCGVAMLVGLDHASTQAGAGWAIAAALTAAFCYGIATTYAKTAAMAKGVEPFANAHGSMWGAALTVLPALLFFPPPAGRPGAGVFAAVLALGIVCSGIAYLLYFRLIKDVGATSALTVTFLVPVFGILWGCLFLGETIGVSTLVGAAVVVTGTALVTDFRPALPWRRKATPV
jgi:drug/metabolite transporter (DMT)-like permease